MTIRIMTKKKRQFIEVAMSDEFITPDELAARWKVTRRTITNWQRDGILPPPVSINGYHTLYRLSDIEQIEKEREKPATVDMK